MSQLKQLRMLRIAAALVLSMAPAMAPAALLGLDLNAPLLFFNNEGITSYDATTDQFTVEATPLAFQLVPGTAPVPIGRPAELTLSITVDSSGALVPGGGPNLIVTGDVGAGVETLLEGNVTAFGFLNGPITTDLYDFDVDLTGGSLLGDYPSGRVGIQMASEQSSFEDDFNVDFVGEAKGTIGLLPRDSACDLTLDKTCLIVSTGSADLACTAKIAATRLRYIGPSISGLSTVQITGGSDGSANYNVELVQNMTVLDGQNGFSIDARPDDLGSKTTIVINGVAEVIHTSCSAPFVAGQPAPLDSPKGAPSPNWLVESFVDKDGTLVSLPDPEFADSCEISLSDGVECDDRPTAITYRYTGGTCADSSNAQDSGKFDCADFGSTPDPVSIVVRKDGNIYADVDDIAIGGSFEATAAEAGRDEFDSEVNIEIRRGGALIQTIRMHTSCSQPLRLGDRYGALEVVGFTNDEQGSVVAGAEVQYRYEITNLGPDTALDISVTDTSLTPTTVPGSPIASLAAGESDVLMASAFIDGPVSGVATASGTTVAGATCADEDETPITVAVPPPCEVASGGFELKKDALKWDIANTGADNATIESIDITWPAQFGRLKEVKLEGDKIFDENLSGPTVLITSFTGDLEDRQIEPGKTDTLEIKFDDDYEGAVPSDILVTLNFAEGCSISFVPGENPFGDCDGKLRELTMIWDGSAEPVQVRAYAGEPGSALVTASGELFIGDEFTAGDFTSAGAPNDVFWEIFDATGALIGESKFHRSCSDDEMDGPEDCGARQGNGKGNDAGLVNDWLLEGLVDDDGSVLDCSEL